MHSIWEYRNPIFTGSTGIQYQLPKSNYFIKFTMICVNLDIYTVK